MQIPNTKKVYEAATILKALDKAAKSLAWDEAASSTIQIIKELLEDAETVEVYCAQDSDKRYANIAHIHTKMED